MVLIATLTAVAIAQYTNMCDRRLTISKAKRVLSDEKIRDFSERQVTLKTPKHKTVYFTVLVKRRHESRTSLLESVCRNGPGKESRLKKSHWRLFWMFNAGPLSLPVPYVVISNQSGFK